MVSKFDEEGKCHVNADLKEGQLVEFPDNYDHYRYAVVTGGFGMCQRTMGSKIFGVFGETEEETIDRYKKFDTMNANWSRRNYKNNLCRRGKIITRNKKDDRGKGSWRLLEDITFGEKPVIPIKKGQTLIAQEMTICVTGGTKYEVKETGYKYTLNPAELYGITERL